MVIKLPETKMESFLLLYLKGFIILHFRIVHIKNSFQSITVKKWKHWEMQHEGGFFVLESLYGNQIA